jgi:peptidoglycan/xylan/chitin deacetylase (PgdA/CDA1 family)
MRLATLLPIGSLLLATACGPSPGGNDDTDGGGGSGGRDGGGGGRDGGGGDGGGGGGDGGGGGVCTDGLGPWTGHDDVAPSASPPCGLSPSQVPQFVSLGFDDNAYSGLDGSGGTGGMTWATQMARQRTNPDGTPVRVSFYMTSIYMDQWQSESPTFVKRAWHTAMTDGNEIGDHTLSHAHGDQFDLAHWRTEIQSCITSLTKPFDPDEVNFSPDASKGIGLDRAKVYGFRTPFLEYNDATLAAVKELGFHYDTSIEDGYQYEQDGTNYLWPYTLDHGSPGHEILVKWGSKAPITPHPGLWELPVHPVIVPPDDKCAQYGVPSGLRARLQARQSWFDVEGGKITGFDYNLWVSFAMTKAEFLATLKYTLDQRLAGNRAPMMFGAHTDYYSSKYTAVPNATLIERQQAIEEFLDYARAKPMVRIKPNQEILEWVRNPVPL